jgi:hypothetical protein
MSNDVSGNREFIAAETGIVSSKPGIHGNRLPARKGERCAAARALRDNRQSSIRIFLFCISGLLFAADCQMKATRQ